MISFVLIIAILTVLFSFLTVSFIPGLFGKEENKDIPSPASSGHKRVLIVDPGHGGEDPGAVGIGGLLEKDLNLSVSGKIASLLEFEGYTVVMTREDDSLLYSKDAPGGKKSQDLRSRLEFEKKYPDGVFISVHMNKFPFEYCRGVQVYYSDNNPESRVIAEGLMKSVKAYIQPENNREIKAADSSIYILNNIKIPAVLIECGFISNFDEAKLLQTDEYRSIISAVFSYSVINSLSNNKER